jgi:hypothetical protein
MEILYSWEVLDPVVLTSAGPSTDAFIAAGIEDFRSAAAYVNAIPYGRTENRDEVLGVIRECRGTCGRKHALLCSRLWSRVSGSCSLLESIK